MKALVTIPSYNRPYEIEKRTGYWLKELKQFDYRVFVEPSQVMYYEQSIPSDKIVATKDDNKLYGQLISIGQYAIDNGYDVVTFIADDMYYTNDQYKKKEASKVVDQMMSECVKRFEEFPKLGVVAFARGMDYFYNKNQGFIRRKKPIWGSCVVRPEILLKLDPTFYTFADLFIAVECVEMGMYIETYTNCTENGVDFKNEGGLQSFDRRKLSEITCERALKKYPECKLVRNGLHGEKILDLDVSFYITKGLTN